MPALFTFRNTLRLMNEPREQLQNVGMTSLDWSGAQNAWPFYEPFRQHAELTLQEKLDIRRLHAKQYLRQRGLVKKVQRMEGKS